MSEAIFVYQAAILVSVVATGVAIGKKPMIAVAFGWLVWTFVMVFTRWLFLFQFCTIAAAFLIGSVVLKKANFPAIQKIIRKAMIGILSLMVIGFCVALYVDINKNRDFVPISSPIPLETPPPQTIKASNFPAQPAIPNFEPAKFEDTVTGLERQYPMLDEKSTVFNPAIVEQILVRKREYNKQGMPDHAAIEKAAHEIMTARLTPRPIYYCAKATVQDFPCGTVRGN